MNFKEMMIRAKRGENEAQEELLRMYQPLLSKEAIVDGVFDEDLYQELCFRFIRCLEKFEA
ncbi:MAG: helix-turn-helix domain-containing protein [Oscillospiraceae bacterium]|nr:helix-turn-helix domain-containing protein [Clostridia bacterium]MBP3699845.1 helix-turn-helix domain-containing protein [Oscillospiraceae bacterium]